MKYSNHLNITSLFLQHRHLFLLQSLQRLGITVKWGNSAPDQYSDTVHNLNWCHICVFQKKEQVCLLQPLRCCNCSNGNRKHKGEGFVSRLKFGRSPAVQQSSASNLVPLNNWHKMPLWRSQHLGGFSKHRWKLN